MYFVMDAFYNSKGEIDAESVFFQATRDALDNITDAFDFVHPLRASMLYTRRKLSEMNTSIENADDMASQAEVDPGHFVHGVGYKESFIDTAWENQEEQLAWLLLNNLFAIYEGWAQRLYSERFESKGYNEKRFIKREKEKTYSKPILQQYNRVYNRLKGRKRSGLITEDWWNKQVAYIQNLKESALRGEITDAQLTAIYDEI